MTGGQWSAAHPGAGSPAGIRADAGRRQTAASKTRAAAGHVTAAGAAAAAGWHGDASTALQAKTGLYQTEMAKLAEQSDADASALLAYANQVEHIQHAQNQLTAARDDLHTQLGFTRRQTAGMQTIDPQLAARLAASADTLTRQLAGNATQLAALAQQRQHADNTAIMALTSAASRGGLAGITGAGGTVTGLTLDKLAQLNEVELSALFAMNPGLANQIVSANKPADVATWWNKLKPEEKVALTLGAPALIGNLEGIPYAFRDQANRISLAQQKSDARRALDKTEQSAPGGGKFASEVVTTAWLAAVAAAEQRLDALENIQKALNPRVGSADRYLVSLTDDQPPLAAVAIGNLDTVQNVTYAIPGMGTDTTGMTGWASSAQNIYAEQGLVDPAHTHAVVAWIGYKTPPIPIQEGGTEVLDTKMAAAGAKNLEATIAGFDAARAGNMPVVNVVAHSYGTTTTAIALTHPTTHVNTFVIIGSAGLPNNITHASDLNADHVYAGQARDVIPYLEPGKGDEWAWTGRDFSNHNINPVNPSFGATDFGTNGGDGLAGVTDHSTHMPDGTGTGYLDRGSESLWNVALATTGHGGQVTAYDPKGLTPLEQGIIGATQQGVTSGAY